MCGIAGYWGSNELPQERIRGCLDLMQRRGPDDHGVHTVTTPAGNHLHLLHRRLSIIDLDPRSKQPFTDGPRTLVYNGELYNYCELREKLTQQGRTFRTTSDTEVLLQQLAAHGWQGLDACEGMWAFALFDAQRNTLMFSRDRFGEKPLYLFIDDTGVYFGSEPKFIFALMGRRLPINQSQLYRYLVNGYKSLYKQQTTFFEGLRELPPGTAMTLREEDLTKPLPQPQRYWQPKIEQDASLTYDQCVQRARDALVRSVQLRLRADVPLAFCLSGGIDSNALVSIAKRVLGYDVHGFTIVAHDERYDESVLARASAKELGIRHTEVDVTPQAFLPQLRELVRYHDSPVCTVTYFAHWTLMKQIAASGYKISISGTGADELFSGYYDHHNAYLHEVASEPTVYETALSAWKTHVAPIVRNPHLQKPTLFVDDPDFRDHIYLNAEEFAAYLTRPWSEPFAEERFTDGLLRNRMLNEVFRETVPPILHEDDLNAMYYSVENRSPFLDRQLFETCYSFPTRHLIRDGFNKAILRDAVRDIAPEAILNPRRKVGFNAPIFEYLDVNDPEVVEAVLGDSPIWEHVRRDKIQTLIRRAHLPNSESKFLFYFLSAKLFLEEYGG